ncbi:MAG TPA: hypothetical protein GX724_02105 [Fibrobacter sp.]|nr:hypothetical protein [Fibrobacter sp.]
MAHWLKAVPAILILSAISFAQYDYDYGNEDETDNAVSSSSQMEDSSEVGDDVLSVGAAKATGDEWDGFQVEEMGLTQWEFQQAKEGGLSREKLIQLVELGIRPTEYLQKSWERLGVDEATWIEQRTQGLEDSDIDRSYRNKSETQSLAYWSLLVPSLYQWKTGAVNKAVWMDVLWVAGVGTAAFLAVTAEPNEKTWVYALIPILAAHVWSFADAFFGTQWENNPDANRFSFGILPTFDKGVAGGLDKGVTGLLQVRF